MERLDPANGMERRVECKPDVTLCRSVLSTSRPDHYGAREIRHQRVSGPDRTRPRSAPAMRRRKGLVQVKVHHVKAQLAGLDDAHERIKVGAIPVDEAASLMHAPAHLDHVLVKQTQGVGIGEHNPRELVVQVWLEGGQVHIPP